MKNIRMFIIGLILLPVLAFGQAGTSASAEAEVSAGITPDNFFYFLDRFDEMLQELFTFDSDAEIRLKVSFAKERKAEIKKLASEKGENDEDVQTAKKLLDENISDIEIEIEDEEENGEEIAEWEKEMLKKLREETKDLEESIESGDIFEDDEDDAIVDDDDIGEIENELEELGDLDDDDDEDWDDRGSNTSSGSSAGSSGSGTSASVNVTLESYTMAQVAAHNTKQNCWTAVSGSVYDLTAWISKHPGGSAAIISLCGIDGTAAFTGQHGGQARPASELAGFKIGTLK